MMDREKWVGRTDLRGTRRRDLVSSRYFLTVLFLQLLVSVGFGSLSRPNCCEDLNNSLLRTQRFSYVCGISLYIYVWT